MFRHDHSEAPTLNARARDERVSFPAVAIVVRMMATRGTRNQNFEARFRLLEGGRRTEGETKIHR